MAPPLPAHPAVSASAAADRTRRLAGASGEVRAGCVRSCAAYSQRARERQVKRRAMRGPRQSFPSRGDLRCWADACRAVLSSFPDPVGRGGGVLQPGARRATAWACSMAGARSATRRCRAAMPSRWRPSPGTASRRDYQPYATVGHWPQRRARNQVHFRLSRRIAAAVAVRLTHRRADLRADRRRRRCLGGRPARRRRDRRGDAFGQSMRVSARAAGGNGFSDSYQLAGAASAIDAAAIGCAATGICATPIRRTGRGLPPGPAARSRHAGAQNRRPTLATT